VVNECSATRKLWKLKYDILINTFINVANVCLLLKIEICHGIDRVKMKRYEMLKERKSYVRLSTNMRRNVLITT
jgi:hypothetical protein